MLPSTVAACSRSLTRRTEAEAIVIVHSEFEDQPGDNGHYQT
jgi:hypothetical protein